MVHLKYYNLVGMDFYNEENSGKYSDLKIQIIGLHNCFALY